MDNKSSTLEERPLNESNFVMIYKSLEQKVLFALTSEPNSGHDNRRITHLHLSAFSELIS